MEKDEAPKVLRQTIVLIAYLNVVFLIIACLLKWTLNLNLNFEAVVAIFPGLVIFAVMGMVGFLLFVVALAILITEEVNPKLKKDIIEIKKKYSTREVQKIFIEEREAHYEWEKKWKLAQEITNN